EHAGSLRGQADLATCRSAREWAASIATDKSPDEGATEVSPGEPLLRTLDDLLLGQDFHVRSWRSGSGELSVIDQLASRSRASLDGDAGSAGVIRTKWRLVSRPGGSCRCGPDAGRAEVLVT